MMWLVIVPLLGTLIVLLEYNLESLVIWLERRRIIKTKSLEWFTNDMLQLQRLVHEELGLGDWSGCAGSRVVPVTAKGQLLGVLDNKDPDHPRLVNYFSLSPDLVHQEKPDSSNDSVEQGQTNANETPPSSLDNADQGEIGNDSHLEAHSNDNSQSTVADPGETETVLPVLPVEQSPVLSQIED